MTARPEAPADHDTSLMTRVATGDAAAFGMIVDRYTATVHRVAYRMTQDRSEAEDIVQDVFVRLWTHAARWHPTGAGAGGWLYRVAMNLCLDRLRRRRFVSNDAVPDLADERPRADQSFDRDRIGAIVAGCLAALPERQRGAIVLTYYEAQPNAAAAEIMEMNVKAFESLLLRARTALRRAIEAGGLSAGDLESVR